MATAAIGMHLSSEILKRCWFLAGPTAVGKSEVAVELARRIDAEIVSLDSMSLYRGMDIGTAKPSPQLRELVPHHLIDVIEPHEEFSVAQYVNAAGRAAKEIVARRRTPLFAGGTGLYLRSLLRGVFEGPPADPDLRSSWRPRPLARLPRICTNASRPSIRRPRTGSIRTTSAGSFALWKSITARANHFPHYSGRFLFRRRCDLKTSFGSPLPDLGCTSGSTGEWNRCLKRACWTRSPDSWRLHNP